MLQTAASSLPIYLRRLAQSTTSKAAFRFHVRIRGSLFPNEMKFKNGTYPFLGILRSHGTLTWHLPQPKRGAYFSRSVSK
jgi:hypothetical protein